MLLSTCRGSSRKTRAFSRALVAYLEAHYLSRGKRSLSELFKIASEDDGRLVLVGERMGVPSKLTFYRDGVELFWFSFTCPSIEGVVERRALPIVIKGEGVLYECLKDFFGQGSPVDCEYCKTLKVGADQLALYACDDEVATLKLRGLGGV